MTRERTRAILKGTAEVGRGTGSARHGAPWAVALLVVLGMSLHLPSTRWGFLWDDFLHQGVLRYGDMIPEVSPLNLYDYRVRPEAGETLSDLGLFPWWTSKDFRVRFFRPVTSLSIYLDYLLYGGWAPGYHFTNILLFGLLLLLAGRLYRNLGCERTALFWALAFLALEDIHLLPVGWIANRNSVVADVFVVATLLGVDRHRRTGRRSALVWAVLSFVLACSAKETAFTALGLVGCYLFFLDDPGGEERTPRSILRVLRSRVFWLFATVAGIYVVVYILTGHGTNTALYSTPWQNWGSFIIRIATFFPVAAGSLFFGVSTDLVYAKPHLQGTIALALVPAVALLAYVMWCRLRRNKLAGFAAGWILIALAPAAGVPTSDRLLIDASLGSSLLLGLFLEDLLTGRPAPGIAWKARNAVAFLLLLCGPVMAAPMTWFRGNAFYRMAAADREVIERTELPRGKEGPVQVFLLNPPSSVLALTMLPTWTVLHQDPGPSFYSLQMARRPWKWRREGERSLIVTFGSPPLLTHRYERLFRTSLEPPKIGEVFETAAFRATVLETSEGGVRRVRLDFERELDNPHYHFLIWRDEELQRISPPRPGEVASFAAAVPLGGFAP
jgi:hypothetical protein